ncbi:hypothetical protein BM86_35590, partial [Bacillus thuringiensis]|nr:hypothetical protein [Bacillus thuringiensis]
MTFDIASPRIPPLANVVGANAIIGSIGDAKTGAAKLRVTNDGLSVLSSTLMLNELNGFNFPNISPAEF